MAIFIKYSFGSLRKNKVGFGVMQLMSCQNSKKVKKQIIKCLETCSKNLGISLGHNGKCCRVQSRGEDDLMYIVQWTLSCYCVKSTLVENKKRKWKSVSR